MENLTELQKKFLEIISSHTIENPIIGKKIALLAEMKPRDSGKEGADMRSVINALRTKGYPICASGDGYWWPSSREELQKYIESFQGRINKEQESLDGMKNGYDKIGIGSSTLDIGAPSVRAPDVFERSRQYLFEVFDGVKRKHYQVPGGKVEEFLRLYPEAVRLN